jgi:histidinol-phosphatase (PHP family)
MRIDYHIHSEFSADSKLDMHTLLRKAIASSYQEIAFTDHFDLIPAEIGYYGIPSYVKYSRTIERIRREFPEISILKGVELGEYHRCSELVEQVLQCDSPPDIRIGSIHVLPDGTNVSEPLTGEMTGSAIESYYQENLALARKGGFDILGHLGIYKRYLRNEPDESRVVDIVRDIFRTIIEKGIALEVNLSGLRNHIQSIIPSKEYLNLYREMGGELLIIGSDSHSIDHFDQNYTRGVEDIISCGLFYLARKVAGKWEMYCLQNCR